MSACSMSRTRRCGLFDGVAVGLVGRWLQHTDDGDMVGGDFPAWLAPLLARTGAERGGVRRASASPTGAANAFSAPARIIAAASSNVSGARPNSAEIVVANHALLLTRAADDARHA